MKILISHGSIWVRRSSNHPEGNTELCLHMPSTIFLYIINSIIFSCSEQMGCCHYIWTNKLWFILLPQPEVQTTFYKERNYKTRRLVHITPNPDSAYGYQQPAGGSQGRGHVNTWHSNSSNSGSDITLMQCSKIPHTHTHIKVSNLAQQQIWQ